MKSTIKPKKYIFQLSGEFAAYLDWKKENNRRAKSDIVRTAIVNKMKGDKEFQQYISRLK